MIAIVDYGMGNLMSLSNALKKLNIEFFFLENKSIDKEFSHIILPGVGAYSAAIEEIKKRQLDILLSEKKEKNIPILGICLGMQILSKIGTENKKNTTGLNFIPGIVENIKNLNALNKCHVGWNEISFKKSSKIFDEIKENSNFYFDHSYYFKTDDEENILCTSNYVECFASGVINKNIIGLQFHPEKSHDKGLKILNNFYNNIYA